MTDNILGVVGLVIGVFGIFLSGLLLGAGLSVPFSTVVLCLGLLLILAVAWPHDDLDIPRG